MYFAYIVKPLRYALVKENDPFVANQLLLCCTIESVLAFSFSHERERHDGDGDGG